MFLLLMLALSLAPTSAQDYPSNEVFKDFVGFRIVNPNAIISMGKQQQVKITRTKDEILRIYSPKGVDMTTPFLKVNGKEVATMEGQKKQDDNILAVLKRVLALENKQADKG